MKKILNRYGETLTECEARLRRERVTPSIAAKYAIELAITFEELKDLHNAAFYRTVARFLENHGQDAAAST